jgi:hypothetical protein
MATNQFTRGTTAQIAAAIAAGRILEGTPVYDETLGVISVARSATPNTPATYLDSAPNEARVIALTSNASETTADPAPAPNGTSGSKYTATGLWQRLKRTAGAWVSSGNPLMTLLGLQMRSRLNVMDYGALGDGVTDDSLAITACFDAAALQKRDVQFPPLPFVVHHLEFRSRVRVYGSGMGATYLIAREDNTYYNIGANVTVTDLDPSLNTTGAGLFDMTLVGRDAFAPESGQHHLVWLNGVTDFSYNNLELVGPRGDGIFQGVGNTTTGKKRNFNVRGGYVYARSGGPVVYFDSTTNAETQTYDAAKWAAGTMTLRRGGNRNPISVVEGDGFSLDYLRVEDFGYRFEPGGLDFEPDNASASSKHLSVQNAKVGVVEVIRGRGNFAAVGWVSYAPNSALDRPMRGLSVGEIRMVDTPGMLALAVNGSEIARSAMAQHNVEVKKFTVNNIQNLGSINGIFGVTLSGIATGTGPILGALVFGQAKIVGDITLSDSRLPNSTVNGDSLKLGQVDGFKARNVTTDNGSSIAVSLMAGKTSTGIDLSGFTALGTGPSVVAEAGHIQDAASNYAPARGFKGSSALAVPGITPTLPRSSHSATVDLNSAAAYPNTYPAGHSSFAFNGGTNSPGPSQGEVRTYIDPAFGADGIGFAVQWFDGRGPGGGSWVRYPASGAAGAPWSVWRQLLTGQVVSAALDFPSIPAGGEAYLDITVTGVIAGEAVYACPSSLLETNILIKEVACYLTNKVRVTLHNAGTSAIDPAAQTWTAAVTRLTKGN